MPVSQSEIRTIAILYDREIVVSAGSNVPCPRGHTCECPQTRKRIQESTGDWKYKLPLCSVNTCPAWSIRELTE